MSSKPDGWFRRKTWYFIGDSHVHYIEKSFNLGLFGGQRAKFLSVGGATASGLRFDRTSQTGALEKFLAVLQPFDMGILPVFQMGEIDCGFIIWYRADKYGETVSAQMQRALDTYVGFLRLVRDAGYRDRMLVTSAVLPTVLDGQLEGEVAHARSVVKASLVDRTELTLEYNDRLAQMLAAEGIVYADIARRFLDDATGLIDPIYRNPDPLDHHLNPETSGQIWRRTVDAALAQLG